MTAEEFQSILEAKEMSHWVENKYKGKDDDKPKSSNKRGGGSVNHKGTKNGQDKRKVQYYNFDKYEHYAKECWHGKGKKRRTMKMRKMWQKRIPTQTLRCS